MRVPGQLRESGDRNVTSPPTSTWPAKQKPGLHPHDSVSFCLLTAVQDYDYPDDFHRADRLFLHHSEAEARSEFVRCQVRPKRCARPELLLDEI